MVRAKLSIDRRTQKTFASNLSTQINLIQQLSYFLLLFENHVYLIDQTLQLGD